ncbi:SMR family transporter [Nonomuraea sp. NPDC050404]|uniref:DMT family transporter n=1 Tax=Nonomuraea sp. NPDC050404 TaxID=3155783 RepID=UPI003402BFB4
MRKWSLLVSAILLEVTATLSMRAALDHPAWYVLMVAGYLGAFTALGLVLREGMALGVAYGIWGAAGVALTALLARVFFGDALTLVMGAGIALVIAGVLCVELGQNAHRVREGSPS